MKLLLDQGLPRSAVRHLRSRGMEAEHVGNLGLARAADTEILQAARQRDAIVVTLDADFHARLALSRAASPSTIRIRIEGLKGDEFADVLVRVIEQTRDELMAGAAVSVDEKRIRLRMLPIGG